MKKRYSVQYYRWLRNVTGGPRAPDAYGASDNLANLVRNAAGRAAIENYRKAIITDKKTGRIQYILKRSLGAISIEKP